MYKIIKITYIYEDGSRKTEKPPYTSCASKSQVESLRKLLIKNFNCKSVRFAYEEC